MRVECYEPECQSKAYIKTRKKISQEVTELYCSCSNVECGHTFVATLAFKHTINPSRNTTAKVLSRLIECIPAEEQQELFKQLKIKRA